MAKHPKHVSLIKWPLALARRNPITTAASLFAIFIGVPGAVASYEKYVEPRLLASHLYVRDQVAQADTLKVLRDLQVESAEGKREATINDIAKWNLEMSKAHDNNAKELIQKQINTLDATRQKLEAQIRTLNGIRGYQ